MSDPTIEPEYMTPEQAEAELSKEAADSDWREHAAKEAAARLATRVEDNVTAGLIQRPPVNEPAQGVGPSFLPMFTASPPRPDDVALTKGDAETEASRYAWPCYQSGCFEMVGSKGAYCEVHAPQPIAPLGEQDRRELAELKEIAAEQARRIEELLSEVKEARSEQIAVRPARAGVPAEGKLTPEHFADLIGTFKAEGVSHFSLESALHGVPVKLALHFMPRLLKRDE